MLFSLESRELDMSSIDVFMNPSVQYSLQNHKVKFSWKRSKVCTYSHRPPDTARLFNKRIEIHDGLFFFSIFNEILVPWLRCIQLTHKSDTWTNCFQSRISSVTYAMNNVYYNPISTHKKDRLSTLNFWHRNGDFSARHALFTRPKWLSFPRTRNSVNFFLAPLIIHLYF